jgi:site-specific DNA recombinase
MKKCGLVIRVSTDRQARNEEGSLKNQLQRLRAHIEYKRTACGEEWSEAARYVLEGVSGKDSMRSPQFAQLFEDIRTGKVNTVLCTALDRVSRSVLDFLSFFERLRQDQVEFVCLKQNYDTTTPLGRLLGTFMMALAQFEREQTADRTKEACKARSERGLWNGSILLGYDPDPEKRGSLRPNEQEAAVVRFVFSHYLVCGSIGEVAKEMNQRGYRTKRYESREGEYHEGNRFCYSTVQFMLRNLAYIGMKEINKDNRRADQGSLSEPERYRVVKAVWPPIIDEDTFWKVDRLLDANRRSNGNGTKPVRHNYILNRGLLWCGKCGGEMEGRSGTGRGRVRYYYYACKNKDCRHRIKAEDVERPILDRIKELANTDAILVPLIDAVNQRLKREVPNLTRQRNALRKEFRDVTGQADALLSRWETLATGKSAGMLREKLDAIAERRAELELGIVKLDEAIQAIESDAVNADDVRAALSDVTEIFDNLQPQQQRELLRLVLHRAEVGETEVALALYGQPPDVKEYLQSKVAQSLPKNSEPPKTLPGLVSQSVVLRCLFPFVLRRLSGGKPARCRAACPVAGVA